MQTREYSTRPLSVPVDEPEIAGQRGRKRHSPPRGQGSQNAATRHRPPASTRPATGSDGRFLPGRTSLIDTLRRAGVGLQLHEAHPHHHLRRQPDAGGVSVAGPAGRGPGHGRARARQSGTTPRAEVAASRLTHAHASSVTALITSKGVQRGARSPDPPPVAGTGGRSLAPRSCRFRAVCTCASTTTRTRAQPSRAPSSCPRSWMGACCSPAPLIVGRCSLWSPSPRRGGRPRSSEACSPGHPRRRPSP